MKGWIFYVTLIVAVRAERLRTFGCRALRFARGLLARIFLPAPPQTGLGALGSPAAPRPAALHLARLVRSEKALAEDLGRQAKLVLRLGAPEFARRMAWDAYHVWKAKRRAAWRALPALPWGGA